ncbi:MAG TPA: PA14 domain-containing protein [Candidatus Limnocylindria bacterium]|nr:PA14 domain-containing protein [Candidatus Limnocylindria bacterium]
MLSGNSLSAPEFCNQPGRHGKDPGRKIHRRRNSIHRTRRITHQSRRPGTGYLGTHERRARHICVRAVFVEWQHAANGWIAQDIGETRGFSRLDTNAFTLRVEGHGTNVNACHFVARSMTSDGQMTARVEQIGGNGFAQAGIMIRSQSHPAVFAAVSLDNDGHLWFRRRPDPDRRETKITTGPHATAPVWLRLQKSGQLVTASWSANGSQWQAIATDAIKLSSEKTWREGEGELALLRASCGVFASSRGKGTTSTARVVPLIMTMHGLLGEYFSGRDFRQLKMARADPQIRFNWGLASPDPSLDKDNFSVRWTGKIIAPKTSAYAFYFDADDGARLWVNEREIPPASLRKAEKPAGDQMIPFIAGSLANIRMEFEDGNGPASVRLGWGLAGKPPEIIPMTNFLCLLFATNSPESIALSRITNNSPGMRGVLLRDGSFLAGTVSRASASAVYVSLPDRKNVPVLNSKIARIYLKPPHHSLPYENVRGQRGVFMKGRDFFESEFRGLDHGVITTSSVLFGMKNFSIEGGEPLVIVLNDCAPSQSGWDVRLLDGTALRTARLIATTQTITVEEPALGSISISPAELFDIRRVTSITGQ